MTGDLIGSLYLDSRCRLRGGTTTGDEVDVRDVSLLRLADVSSVIGEEAAFDALWRVTARVRHLQHTHEPHNLYTARLRMRREGERWKLAHVQLVGEDRVIVPVGPQ